MDQDLLRQVFDVMPEPAFVHDEDYCLVLVNGAYLKIAGLTEAQALGKHYWEVFPIHDGPLPGCSESLKSGETYSSKDEFTVGKKVFLSLGYTLGSQVSNKHSSLHVLLDITANKALMNEQQMILNSRVTGIAKLKNRRFVWANSALLRMSGYTPEELYGQSTSMLFPDIKTYAVVGETAYPLMREGKIFETQLQLKRKDRSLAWFELSGELLAGGEDEAIWSYVDITKIKQLEASLEKEKLYLNTLLQTIPDCVWLKDEKGVYQFCNTGVENLFGRKTSEILGKTDYDLLPKEVAEKFLQNDLSVMNAKKRMVNETELVRASDRASIIMENNKTPMLDNDGNILGVLGIGRDITFRKKLEDQANHMAYYDVLTGLPNRRLLMDRLNQALVSVKRSGHYGALLFIDLDNFKPLNDIHGHEAGDLLLIEVGRRIKSCVREMDTVARIGGDEFVALIGQLEGDEAKSVTEAGMIAEKIRLALAEPYQIAINDGKQSQSTFEHHCTASIGVAVFSGKAKDPEKILSMADAAMYEAKEAGRNQVRMNPAVI